MGFYFIVNHGVPQQLIDEAYAALRRFFALPLEEKMKLEGEGLTTGYVSWYVMRNYLPEAGGGVQNGPRVTRRG